MTNKRSIFEEVGEGEVRSAQSIGLIDQGRRYSRKIVRIWLMSLLVLVVLLIAIGGLTRLTDSGLSITEWAPFRGVVPPLNEADWQSAFDRYKKTDEWRIQNQWMELRDFKEIYWWEWGHRQLAKFIGIIWLIGFLGLLIRRHIPTGWAGRLALIGFLGGFQGIIGWWMVASGLVQNSGAVDVASYRLAIHLGLAFLILGILTWYIFSLRREERDLIQAHRSKECLPHCFVTGLLYMTFLQIIIGSLVAGIDAGQAYNDWPLMDGRFFPANAFALEPLWRNLFESPGFVQFIHRVLGYILLIFGIVTWFIGYQSANSSVRHAINLMMLVLVVQIGLGIMTVLYSAIWLSAIVHQLGAILLWLLLLRARFLAMYPVSNAIQSST